MNRLLTFLVLFGCLLVMPATAQPPGWRSSNYFYRVSAANAPLKKESALYAKPPEYPSSAREKGLEGTGLFGLSIKPDGKVATVRVLKSTGHRSLDEAAISAFRQFWFRPGATTFVRAPIIFTMKPYQWKPSYAEMKNIGDAQTLVLAGGGQ